MTKTERAANRRRQAALRERRTQADIFEIRGVWCHISLHKAIKAKLRIWLKEQS